MRGNTLRAAAIILSATILAACSQESKPNSQVQIGQTAMATIKPSAKSPAQGISGTVLFSQQSHGVLVVADLHGLPPGDHGFHIHEKGDLSAPDLASAGPHFNPTAQTHGSPQSAHHHGGDLGNLNADAAGNAHLEMIAHGITLQGPNGIVGRSVVVHASADDLTSQPAGNSGARIAGGVIEAQK